ncbi:hypothetical protein AB4345_05335 [Vibrio breoganii]
MPNCKERLSRLLKLNLIKLVYYVDNRAPDKHYRRIVTPSGVWLRHDDIISMTGWNRNDLKKWINQNEYRITETVQQHHYARADYEEQERLRILFTAEHIPSDAPRVKPVPQTTEQPVNLLGVQLSSVELQRLNSLYT